MNTNALLPPGEPWFDTDGNLIQAHSGGMLLHLGVYYWYGEDKSGPTLRDPQLIVEYRVDVIGIRCYSSRDLRNWKNEGLALAAVDQPGHDLSPKGICERPKVLYNSATEQFVMWVHIDTPNYESARAGCAVSPSPTGPFVYQGSHKPNGHDCRDMTLFQEESGVAWLIHSAEWNKTLVFSELTSDSLRFTGRYFRQFVDEKREAPVVFERGGLYYLVSSGCTGWDPNPAEYAVAPFLTGPWNKIGNPCRGPGSELTWRCQSSFAFPLPDGGVAFAFDRHNKEALGESRYAWFPVEFSKASMLIEWDGRS